MTNRLRWTAALGSAACLFAGASRAQVGTSFTYQGELDSTGTPYSGSADLRFALFDAATNGNQLGPLITVSNVTLTNGLFTAPIDFGSVLTGQALWLRVSVRAPAGSGSYTTLSPRQPLTGTPYAIGLSLPLTEQGSSPSGALLTIQNTASSGQAIAGWGGLSHGVYGRNGAGSSLSPLFGYGTGVWGDTDNGNGIVGTSGTAFGVYGATNASSNISPPGTAGVVGDAKSGYGVVGLSSTSTAIYGVRGLYSGTTPPVAFAGVIGDSKGQAGVIGISATNYGIAGASASGWGAYGRNGAGSGITPLYGYTGGVWGDTDNGHGLTGTSGTGFGIYGSVHGPSGISPNSAGIVGDSDSHTGIVGLSNSQYGVYAQSNLFHALQAYSISANGAIGIAGGPSGLSVPPSFQTGVWGDSNGSGQSVGIGVYGTATNGAGVYGRATGAGAFAIWGQADGTGVLAAYFDGPVQTTSNLTVNDSIYAGSLTVYGHLSKGSGSFKIDHPLDPEHKYLYHSFVESPDMKNIYDGVATTDAAGYATVTLPDWFQALNQDFRYQLTVIDTEDSTDFTLAKVVREIDRNTFTIRASRPHAKVSWQVTGTRHDAYANAHRVPVEQLKPADEQGTLLYPAEQGRPRELGIFPGLQAKRSPSPILSK